VQDFPGSALGRGSCRRRGDGTVTLTGQVDSWAKRVAAENAAHRVAGVLDVANDLEVSLPGRHERSDTEIAQELRRALEWNVSVPDQQLRSTVSVGQVPGRFSAAARSVGRHPIRHHS
jgi:osmotically-inducible protein OsmY